jgi:gp6-like head-tail connector protein
VALGDNYATLDDLKVRLGINDVTFDDSILDAALDSASRAVENFCSRQFNDVGLLGVSARVYYPDSIVCTEVDDFSTTTGLVIQTDQSGAGVYDTTWATTDYQLAPLNNIVGGQPGYPFNRILAVGSRLFLFPQVFYTLRRAPVRVTARWGWAAVPDPVHQATLIMAEEIAKLKDAPFGVAGFAEFGSVRVVEHNPKAKMLLRPYRIDGGVLVG